jgi:hypothetical protein
MSLGKFNANAVDEAGNVLVEPSCEVRRVSDNALVSLFSDAAGLSPISNPFTGTALGDVSFYTANELVNIVATKGLDSKSWDAVVITGTSALLDATTSATDTTAGSVLKVGDAGILGDAITATDWNTATLNGVIYEGFNLPNAPFAGAWFMGRFSDLDGNNGTQEAWTVTAAGGAVQKFIRSKVSGAWDSTWQELWHTGNLNQYEFGVDAGNDVVATGYAVSTTDAKFFLPVSLLAAPSSITVTNTFVVRDAAGVLVGSGSAKTPVLNASSSKKLIELDVGTMTGLTVGEPLSLRSSAVASKITVNP